MHVNEKSRKKILPVASGKGGVGKTLFTANLGYRLSAEGRRVLVIDLDLGGSNLHTFLGLKNTNRGIIHYLKDKKLKLYDVIYSTSFSNLYYIPGDVLYDMNIELTGAQQKKLIEDIEELDFDFILLDLPTGSTKYSSAIFNISNSGFVLTTPQITSLLNTYLFIKRVLVGLVLDSLDESKIKRKKVEQFLNSRKPGDDFYMENLIREIRKEDKKKASEIQKLVRGYKPIVVINLAKTPEDFKSAQMVRELITNSLMVDPICMGLLYYDEIVSRNLQSTKFNIIDDENSLFARVIERIAVRMVHSPDFPEMPLEDEYRRDTFELARIESELDYEELPGRPEEEGSQISRLLSIINSQSQQIRELQRTIRMLTLDKD